VPGLFAAGEVAAGLHGSNRLGGVETGAASEDQQVGE
jgi:succinate dehydrogenase/fumarate reductase flavoprotein subunit